MLSMLFCSMMPSTCGKYVTNMQNANSERHAGRTQTDRIDFALGTDIVGSDVVPHCYVLKQHICHLRNWAQGKLKHSRNNATSEVIFDRRIVDGESSKLFVRIRGRSLRNQ